MGNQQITDTHWLCGFIDGEGTISANYRRVGRDPRYAYVNVWLSIPNTDPAMIQRCIDAIQALGETPHIVTPKVTHKHHSRWWRVEVKGMKRLHRFLPKIIDGLTGDTKRVAEMVWKLCDLRLAHKADAVNPGFRQIRKIGKPLTSEEEHLLRSIKEINTRGSGNLRDHTFALRKKEDMVHAADESSGAHAMPGSRLLSITVN